MLTVNQTLDNENEKVWNDIQSYCKMYSKTVRWIDVIEKGLKYYKRQTDRNIREREQYKKCLESQS